MNITRQFRPSRWSRPHSPRPGPPQAVSDRALTSAPRPGCGRPEQWSARCEREEVGWLPPPMCGLS
ncbi:hypothetical protein L211DRAFT_90929 [Terfezia boudieri ATCC MYA-4762]|uniref:Uncharacterized protein n=1 Tax=Terfezia boudieri ATCC MYA-4762 TaxID=1051890 RepID=A0A3N4M5Z2_9PEZI|nr:hypothetical protein L211DRAFT_90929 [Terfezia boudieri ATCC MYA-4762]